MYIFKSIRNFIVRCHENVHQHRITARERITEILNHNYICLKHTVYITNTHTVSRIDLTLTV